jgi:phage shock protein E
MLNVLKRILGLGSGDKGPDAAELAKQGALILDVRSPAEFAAGHIAGAVNISVQTLPSRIAELGKGKPIVTCCASGMRSAAAKRILEAAGHAQVANGGSWKALQSRLRG